MTSFMEFIAGSSIGLGLGHPVSRRKHGAHLHRGVGRGGAMGAAAPPHQKKERERKKKGEKEKEREKKEKRYIERTDCNGK